MSAPAKQLAGCNTYLKQVVIPDEIEAWKSRALVFKVIGQSLLADVQLLQHLLQSLLHITPQPLHAMTGYR